jgi:outer membrane protein TolC
MLTIALALPHPACAAPAEIEALVVEAMERNPTVIAARKHYEAQTKMPSQVATLPDPEVSLQQLTVGGPKPFEGSQTSDFFYTGFGVSQEIPWPQKLKLRGREASREAQAVKQDYEAARREVAEKVRENCFELFFLSKRLGLLTTSREQLSETAQFAEDQYRLGKNQQTDLIKAQLAATSMLKEIEMTRQEIDNRQLTLKSILGREIDSRNLTIPEIALTPMSAAIDRDALVTRAAEAATQVRMADATEKKSEVSLDLAKEDYIPDFSVGYTYQKTGPGVRDYYMWTLGAKIPLYAWRKQKPAVEQAALEREAARERLHASKLDTASEIERDWIALKTAERVIAIYRDGLIPQSRAAVESAMATYRTGRTDFQTLLSSTIEQLTLNEEYYRAITDHEIAIAHIEQITGEAL